MFHSKQPQIERGWSERDLWMWLLSNGVNYNLIYRKSISCLKELNQLTTETVQIKRCPQLCRLKTDWEVYLAANICHFLRGGGGKDNSESKVKHWEAEAWSHECAAMSNGLENHFQEALDPRSRKSPRTQNKRDWEHVPRKITGLLWTATIMCLQFLPFSNRSLYCIFSVPVSPLCMTCV